MIHVTALPRLMIPEERERERERERGREKDGNTFASTRVCGLG
jgi:hypothetical protein